MRDALAHRGPDGAGLYMSSEDGEPWREGHAPPFVGLGHRRLSIIDLSDAGSQPMSNEDGTVWITYNGEFYNFADHHENLVSKGHIFRSRCDTESIIHLYEEYGIDETLRRMNGMFAFGIWDARNRTVILARDRVGKKPLYYAEVGGGLIFASEMKALYASGLIDPDALDEQALMESVRYGTPFGARTMFRQIRMLPPGHIAIWRDRTLTVRAYYRNPFETVEPESKPIDAWADELEALLTDAIRIRFISDVPVGLFLSGGIDSSLIAALTVRRLGKDVRTYCVSFSEREFDESNHAREIAAHLGLPLVLLSAEQADDRLYEWIARHTDQPLADSSLIPTYLVSKIAREQHVKVALTGDGGDELFAGYELYRTGIKLWGEPKDRARIRQHRTARERAWELRTRLRGPTRGYLALQRQFSDAHLSRLYRSPRDAGRIARFVDADRLAHMARVEHRPVVDLFQYSDIRTMLVDDVLRKVDLMSMANGLECRCPLLDYRVLEFAARLPLDAKIDRAGRAKALLRQVLGRYVPPALFSRPKMGFCIPWPNRRESCDVLPYIRRWRAADFPHFRADAGDWIFREEGEGAMFRKWNAFTQLVFFENYRNWCAG